MSTFYHFSCFVIILFRNSVQCSMSTVVLIHGYAEAKCCNSKVTKPQVRLQQVFVKKTALQFYVILQSYSRILNHVINNYGTHFCIMENTVTEFHVHSQQSSLIFKSTVSRSYCCTVWSAIGIILLSVRLSFCLWRCAFWLSGWMYAAKSCTSVFLAHMFLFVPFDTFAVGCIV